MQAYEVEFTPPQVPPLRIKDAIRAEKRPHPHISVGDPATPGNGIRVPLTSRLTASFDSGAALVTRATAYRDPKSGRVVLGVEPAADAHDSRALVLLAASSSFPDGVSVIPEAGVSLLARGAVRNGEQVLLIWPDGARVIVHDVAREERHELRRAGDQFDRVTMPPAG